MSASRRIHLTCGLMPRPPGRARPDRCIRVLIVTTPRVALAPSRSDYAEQAIRDGGGEPVDPDAQADALVWADAADMDGLRDALAAASSARWVQLPWAGIEKVVAAGLLDSQRAWTSAKGCYAEPVAEHALALALAGLRLLRERITARSWGKPAGTSLYDRPVTILGGGGITVRLLELLAPLRTPVTVVRHRPDPLPGAARTVGQAGLHEALADAQVVFLALALTPSTEHIIGAAELAAMRPDAWLVNVARGAPRRHRRPGHGPRRWHDRRGRARRHRPRAAARRPSAVGRRALHHHPAHGRHDRDDQAAAGPPHPRQRGRLRRRPAPDRPGRHRPGLLTRSAGQRTQARVRRIGRHPPRSPAR